MKLTGNSIINTEHFIYIFNGFTYISKLRLINQIFIFNFIYRMLSGHFDESLKVIASALPPSPQTLLFSATLNDQIMNSKIFNISQNVSEIKYYLSFHQTYFFYYIGIGISMDKFLRSGNSRYVGPEVLTMCRL